MSNKMYVILLTFKGSPQEMYVLKEFNMEIAERWFVEGVKEIRVIPIYPWWYNKMDFKYNVEYLHSLRCD